MLMEKVYAAVTMTLARDLGPGVIIDMEAN